jgi:hypothetical protein
VIRDDGEFVEDEVISGVLGRELGDQEIWRWILEGTDILDKADLEATYECLKAWNTDSDGSRSANGSSPKSLFAFFNSGDDSGASRLLDTRM